MDSGIQMFTTDSVSTISSGKIVAQTSTFEQTSMTDDDPGIRIIGDNKVELVYKNKVTNEEASIDLYNSNNSSNNAKLYIDNPRGTTSLIIDQNRRLGIGNIVPEAILHLHNHNNSNSEHIRITNNDNLGMNMILTSSNTDIKANFGIRWYNSGSTTLVNNALVIRNLNGTNTVGIGTSTPSYTLDVSGNINFTGTLTQNGSTFTSPYTLPTASSSTLGGVKIGNNLSINGSGVLSATDTNTTYTVGDGGLTENNFTDALKTKLDGIATSANNYSLPAATSSSLGGIKVGTNLSIDSGTGVLSATDTNTTYSVGDGGLTQNNFTDALKTKLDGIATSANNYTLPTAASDTLGGVKVGTNLSIDGNGVLSATDTNTTYSVGDGGLTQNNFTNALKTKLDGIATSANNYTLPTAASGTLGGVKVGNNLSIDGNGVLSATDTNTTYSVGDGGLTQNNFTDALKTKLDGIATSANNYSLPTSSTSTLGGVKVDGSTITINGSGVISSSGGSSVWTTSGSDIYRSSGNVGIGTTSPDDKLHVQGGGIHVYCNSAGTGNDAAQGSNAGNANIFMDCNNYSTGAKNGIIWKSKYDLSPNTYTKTSAGIYYQPEDNYFRGGLAFYTNGTANESTDATERVRIDKNGYVGIGTTSPSQKLDIEGNGGSGTGRIRFTDTDTADNARNWFIGPYRSSDAAFQIVPSSTKGGTSPDISKTFQVSYNGYVGIGTTSPDYPLDVDGGVFSSTGISGTKFYARAAAHASSHTGNYTNTNISIRCSQGVWAATLFATSDSRIKENIEDVPDKLALEQVRNIPCRYYEYRDKLSRGSGKTIGFIAQEVKSVLPMATSIQTSIIPNVYTNILDVTWEEITETNTETGVETNKYKMRTSTLTNISGIKYKFYVSNTENDEVEKIVTGNDDSTFTFEQQWTNVFCYGYEVEDFHVLDKNKLFALNFSATQELDRIQQQELTKVKDLEIENFLLKERVKDLESKMNDVLNKLAQLENN